MFHSIRWRLVASYVFLAVMTISVVGFLAIEIVQTTSNQREVDEMQASAQAIAHQATNLIGQQPIHLFPLSQLVRTTAFLGNFRVRILDAQHNAIADSGAPGEWNDMVWIAPPQGTDLLIAKFKHFGAGYAAGSPKVGHAQPGFEQFAAGHFDDGDPQELQPMGRAHFLRSVNSGG